MDVRGLYVLVLVLVSMLSSFKVQSYFVNITYVESAVAKGAVCLDGSPPAYHFSPGFGSGVNNWLVHFEGGGWCNNVTTCLKRIDTRLGSSKFMKKQVAFSGIFSNKACYNPAFYDWNKVKVRYCDGSSFTGDIEEVDPATNLHYRGARIFLAVIEDLKEKGLAKATNALLSGCSAGGLTAILHCDEFQALLPTTTNVKCLSDAGYFINIKDLSGVQRIKYFYDDVIQTHGSAKNLDPSCISEMDIASMCFFPQYIARQIQTPLFILNAAYDSWQIKNILVPGAADPHGTWHDCKNNIKLCSSAQLDAIQYFRLEFVNAFSGSILPTSGGFYINSCYAHCQSEVQETWLAPDSPLLGSASISEAVRDWYYDYKPFRMIDCPYPCDSTCHNRVFEASSGLQKVKDRHLFLL